MHVKIKNVQVSMILHVTFEKRARFVSVVASARQIEDAFGLLISLSLKLSFLVEWGKKFGCLLYHQFSPENLQYKSDRNI